MTQVIHRRRIHFEIKNRVKAQLAGILVYEERPGQVFILIVDTANFWPIKANIIRCDLITDSLLSNNIRDN